MNNNKHQLTQEGYNKIQERLQHLKEVELPRVIEAIKEARAQGDLSENAEYEAARDEQASIVAQIKEDEEILKNAIIIKESDHTNNIGKYITVTLEDLNEDITVLLKSSTLEAEPLKNIISRESPFGKAILEAHVGDRVLVKPENESEYYIIVKDIKKAL